MNPPYGKTGNRSNAAIWAAKLGHDIMTGAVEQAVVVVGVNHTQHADVQTLCELGAVCITNERIAFYDVTGVVQSSPPRHNAIIYVGPNVLNFAREYKAYGMVLKGVVCDV